MKSGRFFESLVRRARYFKRSELTLPPGFDPVLYCSVNPDVAAACPTPDAAARHYLLHGRTEMRRILPDGVGVSHPQSRMIKGTEARRNWMDWLRAQASRRHIASLLKTHPRAPWLETGFVLSAYLLARPDVADKIDTPLQAAFHFLEFGLEEGTLGRPHEADPRHLRRQYGAVFDDLPRDVAPNVDMVMRRLREAGHDALNIALTEVAFWELQGYSGAFLAAQFDHEVYLATAQHAGLLVPSSDRLSCIRHFCETGADAGLLAHPDLTLQPRFYLEHLLEFMATDARARAGLLPRFDQDAQHLEALAKGIGLSVDVLSNLRTGSDPGDAATIARLSRHFLRNGARKGAMANFSLWARRYFGFAPPIRLAKRLTALCFDVQSQMAPLERLQRMLTRPSQYMGHLPELEFSEASVLVDLADRLTVSGDNNQAEWLYRTVLSQYADHERALNHLADLMKRMGRTGAEYQLRAQSRALPGPKRGGGVWNLLFLAECFVNDDMLREAIDLLEQCRTELAGDAALYAKYQALTDRLFNQVWGQIGVFADIHGIIEAQDLLQKALEIGTPLQHGPIPERRKAIRHVALVGSVDQYQCKLYRVDQKTEQLRAAGYEVSVFHPYRDIDQFRATLSRVDAAIFFRLPAFPKIMEAITDCAAHGVPSFYEIDDLIFGATHFPPPFETYAGRITPAQYRDIACGVPLYAHALKLCDYAIASTRTLCEQMAPYVRSGRAFEHHNALGIPHYNAIEKGAMMPPRSKDQPITLFYGSGTLAHKDDFHNILEPALAEILRRYRGRVELHFVGSFSNFKHLDPLDDALRFEQPVWDFEQYCLLLAAADINLSVLSPGLVTDSKSEIKWMEAAMLGIPSVLSRTATHEDVVVDGETGFLCDTKADFIRHLSALIENAELRLAMGARAREQVLAQYDLSAMGRNLSRIFDATQAKPVRKKPRVVVVNVFYPPQAIGGATRVVADNIKTLAEDYGEIFDVHVICSFEGARPYSLQAWQIDGVAVWGIGTPDQGGTEMHARDPHMEPIFGELLDRLAPDLVHFHCIQRLTSSVVDATRKRGIPYLITFHDGWWISPRQFLLDPETDTLELYDYNSVSHRDAPARARCLYPALLGAKRLLAVSEPFAQVHRACNLPEVLVCENGVSELPKVTRRPHPDGRVRLAVLGGTERHKGLHLLRNALFAGHFDNLELLIVDHALKADQFLEETWGTTPVLRRGKVPQSQVSEMYASIDVLIAPSVWPEAYGLVTREALATDAWVVASDRGGVGTDVIEGVNGHVVSVEDASGLMRVLSLIDTSPERYQKPPEAVPQIRPATAQAHELARHYAEVLNLAPVHDGAVQCPEGQMQPE